MAERPLPSIPPAPASPARWSWCRLTSHQWCVADRRNPPCRASPHRPRRMAASGRFREDNEDWFPDHKAASHQAPGPTWTPRLRGLSRAPSPCTAAGRNTDSPRCPQKPNHRNASTRGTPLPSTCRCSGGSCGWDPRHRCALEWHAPAVPVRPWEVSRMDPGPSAPSTRQDRYPSPVR